MRIAAVYDIHANLAYRRDRTLSVATKTFVGVVNQLSEYLKQSEGSAHS